MSDLAQVSMAIGAAAAACAVPLLVAPQVARRGLLAFPRHAWTGRVLTAAGVSWTVLLLRAMTLGFLDPYKAWLYVAAPVAFLLIIIFMDELLAPRALGGLLLLAGSPVLAAAQWHAAPLKYVVVVSVYIWVIAGIVLVLSPYRFRTTLGFWIRNDSRCRLLGAMGTAYGALLVLLGLKLF
jgi:hypothetical protein